ncbi:MAG: T9SS type A sorting domain-containing protein [Ignavibacteria bacterium]|jgi:photosystem II stability/assembly factor-like uncharacterized protein|nr:T9SS type A sorting domain-containing protein [Ignavibacteria bacterium]
MKSLLILINIVLFTTQCFAQWYTQQSGTNSNLNSVSFTSESKGHVVGSNVILRTDNGGINWSKTILSGEWNSVSFPTANTGYICGTNGKILKTTDGGTTWFNLTSGTQKNLTSINFKNDLNGYVLGWFQTMLVTSDGGATFANYSGYSSLMYLHSFIMNNFVFLIGTEGALFKSTNYGVSFDSINIGMPNSLFAIQFFPNGKGFVFGCCGAFFKTNDFGQSWSMDTVYLTKGWALVDCSFANEHTGWSVGEQGNIVRTYNSGDNWDSLGSGTNQSLKAVKFVNSTTGWVVGNEGTILKTTNGGGQGFPIGIYNYSNSIPEKFNLFQNYPNPFNPSTTIEFSLPENSFTQLKIYDISGKQIATLVQNELPPGFYRYTFNSSEMNSGTYFYILTTEKFSESRKMVVLK